MEKLIIENHTELPMQDILRLAQDVVKKGRISNDGKQYCYLISYNISDGSQVHAASCLNKNSDRLSFYTPQKFDHESLNPEQVK